MVTVTLGRWDRDADCDADTRSENSRLDSGGLLYWIFYILDPCDGLATLLVTAPRFDFRCGFLIDRADFCIFTDRAVCRLFNRAVDKQWTGGLRYLRHPCDKLDLVSDADFNVFLI